MALRAPLGDRSVNTAANLPAARGAAKPLVRAAVRNVVCGDVPTARPPRAATAAAGERRARAAEVTSPSDTDTASEDDGGGSDCDDVPLPRVARVVRGAGDDAAAGTGGGRGRGGAATPPPDAASAAAAAAAPAQRSPPIPWAVSTDHRRALLLLALVAGALLAGVALGRAAGLPRAVGAPPPLSAPSAAEAAAADGARGRPRTPPMIAAPPVVSVALDGARGGYVVRVRGDDTVKGLCVTVKPVDGSAHASACGGSTSEFLIRGVIPGGGYNVVTNVLFKHHSMTALRASFHAAPTGAPTFLPALSVTPLPPA